MDLKKISLEINDLLEKRRKDISLSFVEENHVYFMENLEGDIKNNFPSVSTVLKCFYEPFDSETISLKKARGDYGEQQRFLQEWQMAADKATNMGSRVHYELEKELVRRYGNYKEVRQPIFEIDEDQKYHSDFMINAGKNFIDKMEERGAVLLDTEIVLGDNDYGYTGQPDKVWLMENKAKDNFGIVITDWKTNQPKNFEVHYYTGQMFPPFEYLPDTALSHYYIQIPLYGKLLLKMLKGTKYENIPYLGGVVVLLTREGEYVEYKIPQEVNKAVLNMNIKDYLKYGQFS